MITIASLDDVTIIEANARADGSAGLNALTPLRGGYLLISALAGGHVDASAGLRTLANVVRRLKNPGTVVLSPE